MDCRSHPCIRASCFAGSLKGFAMTKKIAVIDGNSLMHRAFHGVRTPMNAPDGTPTNAAFGFLSMFLKLYETARPDAVICAFDAGRPEFRMKALEQYKAQRPPMDPSLRVQFPVVERILDSMNVPIVKLKGWEGDDILGTIAAIDERLGYETLLVTGDKDAYQLVTHTTRVLTTRKGLTDVVIYGPAEVEERYGVTPAQFPDFLGLKGDSSDNIPGVPGIGDKTAAKLLQAYGSLDGIYEHLDDLKGKQKDSLSENRDSAYVSREVATIMRDAPIEIDPSTAVFPSFETDRIIETFGDLGFNTHLKKVLSLAGGDESLAEPAALELPEEPLVVGSGAMSALAVPIDGGVMVGVELLVPAQESLFAEPPRLYVGTGSSVLRFDGEDVGLVMTRLIRGGRFCCLDAKQVLRSVYPNDTSLAAAVSEEDLLSAEFFDIGLAAYLLDSNAGRYAYDSLCDTYLHAGLPLRETEDEQAAVNAAVAVLLHAPLVEALKADGSLSCYEEIDRPLVSTLLMMERVGAALDAEELHAMSLDTQAEIDEVKSRIYELAGEDFNIDSPKQLGHVLFDVLGLPAGKKNQRGYSTDAATLKRLEGVHEIAGKVMRYRELAKMKSTYLDALPRMRSLGDGRVHTSFNQTVTTTGRLSSSEPNLQNIPVRTEFGRRVRGCFIPLRPGDLFVSADYSQIELRLLAHLSGDAHLVDTFNSGADFHAATASRVFGVPVDEVTPDLRSRAKAVNFGIVYGQQAYGLAQSLGIGFKEAAEMIDRYFEAYPSVRSYLDEVVEAAKADGYASTMFGRKRHIFELKSANAATRAFGERTAMNHPMQGSAADIIKLAMNEVQRRLVVEGFESQLMLQVHDELDFSVPACELEALTEMASEVMSTVVPLKVPLIVEISSGANWTQAH